jgi:hypothetical protein
MGYFMNPFDRIIQTKLYYESIPMKTEIAEIVSRGLPYQISTNYPKWFAR